MSVESKKSLSSTLMLMTLGIAALCLGTKWLIFLIPAAVLVWYASCPRAHGGRN